MVDIFVYVRSYSKIEKILRKNSLQSVRHNYENLDKIFSFVRIMAK